MKNILFIVSLLGVLPIVSPVAPAASQTVELPSAVPESAHLQLSEEVIAAGENLWFQGVLLGNSPTSNVLYVEVLNPRAAVIQCIFPVRQGIIQGAIAIPDTLSGGWYQVRAYTQKMRNAGVANFGYRQLLVVNPSEENPPSTPTPDQKKSLLPGASERVVASSPEGIAITLNKTNSRPRDSLTVRISTRGKGAARGAVSIRKINSVTDYQKARPSPATVADPHLTQPRDSGNDRDYRGETEGLTVSGRVIGMDQQTKDRMVLLSVPGRNPYLEYDFADQEGRFQVPVEENIVGNNEIVLQAADPSLSVQWILDDKFAPENTYWLTPPPIIPGSALKRVQQSYQARAHIKVQYDLFRPSDSTAIVSKRTSRFYGAPNFTIRSEDYIALPTFVELNRELMPGIRLRKNKEQYNLDVFDIASRNFLDGEPAVFLDGVLIHDLTYLVNFPPSEIELIETVNRRTYYGEYRLNGTIALYTKTSDAYLGALPSSALRQSVTLYTPYQPFSVADSWLVHEPDFRTLLYWQPNATISLEPYEVTFTNADELGEFEITVEAVTDKGELIYGRKVYTVSLGQMP